MSDDESASKMSKLSYVTESDGNLLAIAGPSNEQLSSTPKIFKLDIDCFDEIFEYLSLRDLHSFGATCKTMQQVAGEYFKRNFSAAETHVNDDGVQTVYSDDSGVINGRTSTAAFSQFIPSVIYDPKRNNINANLEEFDSIRHVCFSYSKYIEQNRNELQKIWHKVETVQINNYSIDKDLHENFLSNCTNLKGLSVQLSEWSMFGPRQRIPRLCQQYPRLEHIGMIPIHSVTGLRQFFENNSHIKSFSINGYDLWSYKDELMRLNLQLDLLKVKAILHNGPVEKIVNTLQAMYERGLYQRLHYHVKSVSLESSTRLSLLPALEMLCIENFTATFKLSAITTLKELAILNGVTANDMEILANSLVNLQRVYIGNATINDIAPFIRLAPKLTKLKVIPKDENHFNGGILKLSTMNKERKKLAGACKVTIYVPDNVFLRTKWATKNGDTSFKLIEMKRSDSYEWNTNFY